MIRDAVTEVLRLGPLPPSDQADVEHLQRVQEAIEAVPRPVTLDEARALLGVFGEDDCFGLAWALVTLIETAPGWPNDVDLSADDEWTALLRTRAINAGLL